MRKVLLIAFFVGIAFPAFAADRTVKESNLTFDTQSVTIDAGDAIVFTNADQVTHSINVTGPDGNNDNKGLQKPAQDIRVIFPKRGEYKVHCAISPQMKMTVMVE